MRRQVPKKKPSIPVLFVRLTQSFKKLRMRDRINAMARAEGCGQAEVTRALILLGTEAAERDGKAVARALDLLEQSGAAQAGG